MRTGSYARRERDQVIAGLSKAGVPLHTITLALRHARTLARLAEAQCNGDWPADNGERKTLACGRCEGLWAPQSMTRDKTAPKIKGPGESHAAWIPLVCPDCRAEHRIRELLGPYGSVQVQGDPRGYVASLKLADGREVGLA